MLSAFNGAFGKPFDRERFGQVKAEPLIAAKAKAQQIRKPNSVQATLPEQTTIETREELAKLAGVGARTVDKQRFVREHDPENERQLAGVKSEGNPTATLPQGMAGETRDELAKLAGEKSVRWPIPIPCCRRCYYTLQCSRLGWA